MANFRHLTATMAYVSVFLAMSASVSLAEATKASAPDVPGRTALEKRNIATFDDLDFRVFSHRKWDDLDESHAKDILVHWPDGHTTKGIERHIQDLDWMFTFAPDTRIVDHPIRIAENEWTAVAGFLEQTFTKPMKMPDGKVIQPTGKKVKLPMATLGHWKNGVMDEEYLYWDNQEWYRQLGIK